MTDGHVVTIEQIRVTVPDQFGDTTWHGGWSARCTCGAHVTAARVLELENWATRTHAQPTVIPNRADTQETAAP